MKIHIAPVQGHTDAAWRHFHQEIYGGDLTYYTPFIRLEKGDFRKHDLKDYLSPLNSNHDVVAQVIFRNMDELAPLLEGLVERGAKRIDLNSGCPFPLQTAKGRGAAFVGNRKEFSRIPELISHFPEVRFSMKMRLGYEDPGEWRGVIDILNDMDLDHVTLHPRVGRQQYGGDLNMEEFASFLGESRNPVVYNGELKTPGDISRIAEQYPGCAGVMLARGVLGRPSLAAEYAEGKEWSQDRRLETMMRFHDALIDHYSAELCGDHQLLSKIKPFWEYAEEEIGRKAWKAIKKSTSLPKYRSAVAMI